MGASDEIGAGLLERAGELRGIRRALDAAVAGEATVGLIAAQAGMGKTALLDAAVAAADAIGVRALVARASELERDFAFGVVRQLIEGPVVTADPVQREALLSGAARHAAAVFELDAAAALDRDMGATLHGLYWLLVNLNSSSPLLVAVDDLPWADEASLRFLAYLARRLEGLRLAVITTARTDEAGRVELSDDVAGAHGTAVEEIMRSRRALRLEPAALSAEGTAALLERLLDGPVDPIFADACRAHTGGIPFLLSELAVELVSDRIAPTRENVETLRSVVPERVGEMVGRHLARLGQPARDLAGALAVLGDGGDLAVAARLAGMEPEQAVPAAAALVRAQILAAGAELRFRHPLVRAAIEAETPSYERAARHDRAARLLAERGAPNGLIAAHLLASPAGGGDAWVVERLQTAARSARAQGAPQHAVPLLRRALDEPPPPQARAAVLSELGTAALRAFDPECGAYLEAALAAAPYGRARGELAARLASAHLYAGRHEQAVDALLEEIAAIQERPDLRETWLVLEGLLASLAAYTPGTERRAGDRIHPLAASLAGDTHAERLVLAMATAKRPGSTAEELFRAARQRQAAMEEHPWMEQAINLLMMYVHAHRPDAAGELAERMLAEAVEEASSVARGRALAGRAMVALEVGDLRSAEADFTDSLDLIPRHNLGILLPNVGLLVQALTGLGELAAADAVLDRFGLQGDLPEWLYVELLLHGRGLLRLAQSDWGRAEADLREIGRRQELWGIERPVPPWRSACAQVRLGVGDREGARELAAAELERARAWDTPKALATALRALALGTGGEAAIELLGEAAGLLEGAPWRLERAQVRCDLGAALRRAGRRREAREALALAMHEAHACGAEPLAERAGQELRASGARPRRRALSGLEALTPSERRVAEIAAAGRTNREIAQKLFVTTATVETHLTRVYRKLDLDGREGLADAL